MKNDSGIGINKLILKEIDNLNIPKHEKDLMIELLHFELTNYSKGVKLYTDHYVGLLESYISKV